MPTQKLLERKALIVGIVVNVLQVLAGMAVFFMTGLKAMFLDFSFTAISVLSGLVAVYLSTRVAYDYFVFGPGERIETGPVVIYEILTVIVCFSLYMYYRRSNRAIGNSSTMLTAECKSTLVDGSMSFGIGVIAVFLMLLPAGGPLDFLHYTGDFFITVALVVLTIREPFSVLKEAFVELVGGVHDDDETNAYVEAEAQRHLPANTEYEQTLIFKTGMNYTVDVYLAGTGETIDVSDLIERKRSLEKELTKRLHLVDVDFVFD